MKKTLLVVDDAGVMRRKIIDVAQNRGWLVVGEASDGREAARLYAELRPLAMTLDLAMPHHDGITALEEIMGIDPQARVVIVSALRDENLIKRAMDLGASDFIEKPFNATNVINALECVASSEWLKPNRHSEDANNTSDADKAEAIACSKLPN